MGFWDRFRRSTADRSARREQEMRETQANYCTESFRQILSAAKALRHHHGINRTQAHFDDMLGYGLAQRYTDQTEEMAVMTAAILASHCGPDAVTMFVLHLRDRGLAFGLRLSEDRLFPETPLARKMTGTLDIYGLAADYAASGELEQDSGPFRGPAQILWDAGYTGLPRDDLRVDQAAVELVAAALNPWNIRLPAKPGYN
jgi:hypothetical protein